MIRDLFPIDDKSRTFSYTLHRMVKLTPNMARLVRALNEHGHIDPIRDGGTSSTYAGLVDRGIIRPHTRRIDPRFPATTPEQVWDEAHAEYDRRDAETKAHAECPEQWVQVDEDGTESHVRQSRQGYPIEVERGGHRFWYVRINGRTSMTAGGTFEEARLAADWFEAAQVYDEARTEYRKVTRAARKADADAYQRELASKVKPADIPAQVWEDAHAEHLERCDRIAREQDAREADGGWGQPDGMMGTTEAERQHNASAIDGMARRMAARVTEMRQARQQCPAGHIDAPTTDGGTCAECEQPIRDVHTSHCCKRHGCKYGYGDPAREARCTVASGKAPQEYPCEVCEDDPEPGEQLAAALGDLAELRRETFRLWSAGTVGRRDGLARLDRIEAALRGAQQR